MRSLLKIFIVLDLLCVLTSIAIFVVGLVVATFQPPAEIEAMFSPAALLLMVSIILLIIVLPCLLFMTLGALLAVRNSERLSERVLDI